MVQNANADAHEQNTNSDSPAETPLTPENQEILTASTDYEAEMNKYKDNWLRTAAEVENVKRRAKQDIDKAAAFAIESFAKDLVIILDYLYNASQAITDDAAKENEQLKNAKEGIEITKKEMLSTFDRNAIKRIYPKGEKFDHNTQQAVLQVESDQPADTVMEVLQAGYILKDRLLRPAMVTVSKGQK
jgi:molecular chaperone GrpE